MSLTGLSPINNRFLRFPEEPTHASCRVFSARRLEIVEGWETKIKNLFLMAVFLRLCSVRHWAKCSAVSCCSPVAESRPSPLIHSVNKSGPVIDVRSDHTPFKNSPPTSQWRRGQHVGGGAKPEPKRERAESPKRERNNPPTKKTSLHSFVPHCRGSGLILLGCTRRSVC